MKVFFAVVAGYLAWTALWLGGGAIVQSVFADAIGADNSIDAPVPLVLFLVLSIVCSLVAGLFAQKLSGSRAAVWILGLALLATGIGVQASVWSLMPVWFHLTFLILLVPVCLAGAVLAGRPTAP